VKLVDSLQHRDVESAGILVSLDRRLGRNFKQLLVSEPPASSL